MNSFQVRLRQAFSRENLPRSRFARIALGAALVLLGLVGFLPVLGFWMIPLGLAILAVDVPVVRHFRRRVRSAVARWWPTRRRSKGEHGGQAPQPAAALDRAAPDRARPDM